MDKKIYYADGCLAAQLHDASFVFDHTHMVTSVHIQYPCRFYRMCTLRRILAWYVMYDHHFGLDAVIFNLYPQRNITSTLISLHDSFAGLDRHFLWKVIFVWTNTGKQPVTATESTSRLQGVGKCSATKEHNVSTLLCLSRVSIHPLFFYFMSLLYEFVYIHVVFSRQSPRI